MKKRMAAIAGILLGMPMALAAAEAGKSVKVTPLGSHDGEFCARDRALVFEDPNGTRILYDAGGTVAGPDDPRLGEIDLVLVSHVHGDHIGTHHIAETNAGSCGQPELSVDATPASLSVQIAIEKKAKIVTGSEMPAFFARKLEAAGGKAEDSVLVRFGAVTQQGGVEITTVPATHSNGLAPELIEGALGDSLAQAGLTAAVGPATGYILKFSNGLVAYLSGDTGMTAEQEKLVGDYYGAQLAVINIGDTYTTGPTEAAYVVNEWIEPAAVIPSHANEAATVDGTVRDNTRTRAFMDATDLPVYLPLSGKTMAFDATANCTQGC